MRKQKSVQWSQEEGMWEEYDGKSVVLEREFRQKGYGKEGKLLRAKK